MPSSMKKPRSLSPFRRNLLRSLIVRIRLLKNKYHHGSIMVALLNILQQRIYHELGNFASPTTLTVSTILWLDLSLNDLERYFIGGAFRLSEVMGMMYIRTRAHPNDMTVFNWANLPDIVDWIRMVYPVRLTVDGHMANATSVTHVL